MILAVVNLLAHNSISQNNSFVSTVKCICIFSDNLETSGVPLILLVMVHRIYFIDFTNTLELITLINRLNQLFELIADCFTVVINVVIIL